MDQPRDSVLPRSWARANDIALCRFKFLSLFFLLTLWTCRCIVISGFDLRSWKRRSLWQVERRWAFPLTRSCL